MQIKDKAREREYQRRYRERHREELRERWRKPLPPQPDLPNEQWLPVADHEAFYAVSDYGRVKSMKTRSGGARAGRILSPSLRMGYPVVIISYGGRRWYPYVHRLVAAAFIRPPQPEEAVNHIDGCKTNNHVSNLEWVTYSENTRHSYATGLQASRPGERHHNAKLTDDQVRTIRQLRGSLSQTTIARRFGITQTTVGAIQRRTTWAHVPD